MLRTPWKPLLVFWSLMILVVTLTPGGQLSRLPETSVLPHLDKVVHFFLFAGFGLIHTVTLLQGKRPKAWVYLCSIVLITGILFGIATEILQALLPIERDGSFADLLANCLGVIAGIVTAMAGCRRGWFGNGSHAYRCTELKEK